MQIIDSQRVSHTSRSFLKPRTLLTHKPNIVQKQQRRTHHSLSFQPAQHTIDNCEQSLQIYFNSQKRKNYLHSIVNNYFPNDNQNQHSNTHTNIKNTWVLARDQTFSSQSANRFNQRKRNSQFEQTHLKFSLKKFSTFQEKHSLPIIAEDGLMAMSRPQSQYRPSVNLNLQQMNMDQSMFVQSNKSLIQSTLNDHEIQSKNNHYQIIMVRKAGKKINRLRIYERDDDDMLIRQLMVRRLGVNVVCASPNTKRIMQYPILRNMREECYSIIQEKKGQQTIYLLFPTQYYYNLFANCNQELVDIVVCLAKIIARAEGNIANNQINLQNILKISQKQYMLLDWGCASARQSMVIQDRKITNKLDPFCKQQNKWIAHPEYLSPQLLRAIQSNDYQSIWQQKGGVGSTDIWSIGCLIFEILTLIPLWATNQCFIKGRTIPKRGHLSTKLRSTQQIRSKQRHFKTQSIRIIKQQYKHRTDVTLNPKLLSVLPRMLEQDPYRRISAQQIIQILS